MGDAMTIQLISSDVPMRPRVDSLRKAEESIRVQYANRPVADCPGALMAVRKGEQPRRVLCASKVDDGCGLCASCSGIEREARSILRNTSTLSKEDGGSRRKRTWAKGDSK
jgi:hypothetical protein